MSCALNLSSDLAQSSLLGPLPACGAVVLPRRALGSSRRLSFRRDDFSVVTSSADDFPLRRSPNPRRWPWTYWNFDCRLARLSEARNDSGRPGFGFPGLLAPARAVIPAFPLSRSISRHFIWIDRSNYMQEQCLRENVGPPTDCCPLPACCSARDSRSSTCDSPQPARHPCV